jgi:hypothetical protein
MSAERPSKIPVVFYRTVAGAEVVRNWLRSLDGHDRNAIGQDLMRAQYLGITKRPPKQSDCSNFVQRAARQNRASARVYKENAENVGRRPESRPQARQRI